MSQEKMDKRIKQHIEKQLDKYRRYLEYCNKRDYYYEDGFKTLRGIIDDLSQYMDITDKKYRVESLEHKIRVTVFITKYRTWMSNYIKWVKDEHKRSLIEILNKLDYLSILASVEEERLKQREQSDRIMGLLREYLNFLVKFNINDIKIPDINEDVESYKQYLKNVLMEERNKAINYLKTIGGIYTSENNAFNSFILEYPKEVDRDLYKRSIKLLQLDCPDPNLDYALNIDCEKAKELGIKVNIGECEFIEEIVRFEEVNFPSLMREFMDKGKTRKTNNYCYIAEVDEKLKETNKITDYEFIDSKRKYARYFIKNEYEFKDGYYLVSTGWGRNCEYYYKLDAGKWFEVITECKRVYREKLPKAKRVRKVN